MKSETVTKLFELRLTHTQCSFACQWHKILLYRCYVGATSNWTN